MRKPRTVSEKLAVIFVSTLTLGHFVMHIAGGFHWGFVTGVAGILFLLFFFLNKPVYGILIMTWAGMQALSLKFPTSVGEFDLQQMISMHFGFTFNGDDGGYLMLGVNPVGIALFVLATKVSLESVHGRKFMLTALKNGTILDNYLPGEIEVVRRMKVGEEKSWYLVKFTAKENYAFIRGKDEMFLKSGERMIVKYLVVDNPDAVINISAVPASHYTSGAWAVIG